MRSFCLTAVHVCTAVVLSHSTCSAGSINISPVRIDWSPSHPTTALRILNSDSQPTIVQVHAVTWSNQEGVEQYSDSSDIIINPPILTIAPGKTQIVRVGLRRPISPERELTYRLFFEEVPGGPHGTDSKVHTLLRLGVPFFVTPRVRQGPRLMWQIAQTGPDQMRVSVENQGAEHEKFSGLCITAVSSSGVTPVAEALPAIPVSEQPTYVLSGEKRVWTVNIHPQRAAHEYLLTAKGSAGDIVEKLTPDARQPAADTESGSR